MNGQLALQTMKTLIADMDKDSQRQVHAAAEQIRAAMVAAGSHGKIAISLVSFEMAAE